MLKKHFSNAAGVTSSPIFDLAGTLLELLAEVPSQQRTIARDTASAWANEYAPHERQDVLRAISEAWSWLESSGFIAEELSQGGGPNRVFITRAGSRIKSRSDFMNYAREHLLPKEILRADLSEIAMGLFLGGHFEAAVAAAFKQVEVYVRECSRLPDDCVGVDLMRKAFNPQSGPLTDTEAVMGEREGAAALFAGAMGYFKNPFSHRSVGISHAVQAASLILFANELIARVRMHKVNRDEIDAAAPSQAQ